MTAREAMEAQRRIAHAMGGDPYGVRTVEGAKAAYVRGEIEVDEFERRVEVVMRADVGEMLAEVRRDIDHLRAQIRAQLVHTAGNTGTSEGQNVR